MMGSGNMNSHLQDCAESTLPPAAPVYLHVCLRMRVQVTGHSGSRSRHQIPWRMPGLPHGYCHLNAGPHVFAPRTFNCQTISPVLFLSLLISLKSGWAIRTTSSLHTLERPLGIRKVCYFLVHTYVPMREDNCILFMSDVMSFHTGEKATWDLVSLPFLLSVNFAPSCHGSHYHLFLIQTMLRSQSFVT